MNNEPVMWWDGKELTFKEKHFDQLIPLYLHPEKTLTDEEIDSIWTEMSEQCDEEFIDMKQFARAILKEAEK